MSRLREEQVAVLRYAFVFCAPSSTRIIPRQTTRAVSRRALNAKSDVVDGAMCSWKVS